MQKRTIEQFLKFDNALPIGRTPVTIIRRDGSEYPAVVEITARGAVHMLAKPTEEDMYSTWFRFKGDVQTGGAVIVWGARNPEILAMFEHPSARVDFRMLPQ